MCLILGFNQAKLLVLSLATSCPLRWHVNAFFFFLVTLLFRLVHTRWLVLSGTIHSIQDQRSWARVDELVLSAGGHDDEVACFDVLVFARNRCFTRAGGEGEDLIDGVFLWCVSACVDLLGLV